MAFWKTVSRWKILLGWLIVTLASGLFIWCLIDGDVIWGKGRGTHYKRSDSPVAYWLIMALYLTALGFFITELLTAKLRPERRPNPPTSLPRRDGTPVDRK